MEKQDLEKVEKLLSLAKAGKTDKQISDGMNIQVNTVAKVRTFFGIIRTRQKRPYDVWLKLARTKSPIVPKSFVGNATDYKMSRDGKKLVIEVR